MRQAGALLLFLFPLDARHDDDDDDDRQFARKSADSHLKQTHSRQSCATSLVREGEKDTTETETDREEDAIKATERTKKSARRRAAL